MSTSESDYHIPECRSFWNTATHDTFPASNHNSSHEDLKHSDFERARVHPKFLHSNATSHKWAFGAIAELLDNAVDEISNGATFIKVDRYFNKKYISSPILLFQDDGGGMSPDGIRNCMSLGFSSKRSSNMIGQYGNGFKTSTMRLGADVIVFSCNNNLGGGRATQSIGLLSYTFLTRTMKNDIIVPMLDFEIIDGKAIPTIFGSQSDWDFNLKLILEWSPFSSMEDLLMQFKDIGLQGTKVFIYNLWCNNDGLLELDFEEDNEDIRLRDRLKAGGRHNELIQSHISYTFSYSFRDYISILYLKKMRNFSIILRGKPVEQLNISAEMKFSKVVKYRPHVGKDNFVNVNIGFTKEAPLLGTYGLNVYHKNRLIKPFWKVHEEHGVRGKCVIGTLEANFIEPAHDKQDFERSPLYNRLATRLKNIVLEYWNLHCHLIGYQSKCKSRIDHMESERASQVDISVDEASCSLDIPVIPVIELNTTSHQLERPLPSLIGPAPHLPRNFHNNFHPTCFTATTESRCEMEDGNIDTCEFSDPMSLEKLREENILLFAKREELRKRKAELKQEMEELQRDLAETKKDIEARRKQMATAGDGGGIGGLLKVIVADGLMTFLFVFCVSTLGPLTSLILASPLYDSLITFLKSVTPPPNLIVTTFVLFVFLLILTTIAPLLGGASFNPTSTVAFHAAGFKPNSLISMSLRFPAQALGAVAGAVSISSLMPIPYNRMLPGPRLKVDLHVGGFVECVLTFLVCFGILWIVTRGPNNPVLKVAMIALTTVTLVVSGSNYTGPAMNPANAYAWAYVNNHHNTWEHLYVYWMCPFIGSILAAWVFRFIFPPLTPTKTKKA